MSDSTALGDRMKRYEAATHQVLPPRSYCILRVDIRAAHTYLRHADKPFDIHFMADMDWVAKSLCMEVSGAKFAYTQSDEISVLITDFDKLETQPWFGGVVAKQQSIAASIATAELMTVRPGQVAHFDARVFTLPDAVEVANYFVWRHRDAVRNSISMLARHFISHKKMEGKSTDELKSLLLDEHGIDWNDTIPGAKYGRITEKALGAWIQRPADPWDMTAKSGSWLANTIPPRFAF